MKLVKKISDYSEEELALLGARLNDFLGIFKEACETVDKEIQTPTPPTEGDNLIHLDLRPFTEFVRLQDQECTLEDILDVYEDWGNTFWCLALANVGNYKNKKVVQYLMTMRFLVNSVMEFLTEPSSETDPEPRVG